jgi:transcriptional regulator with XRE-family HTH domain
MDFEAIAADLIRAFRGRRSQTAFSRRLGYRSNVVYRWEAGRAWPTASAALKAARRVGVDLKAGLRTFHRSEPRWLERTDPATPAGVALMLADLRGSTPIGELAKRAGRSRFAVSRWLKGEAEPRLPELLLMVEACSLRLLDWLTMFVDPSKLPSVAGEWAELGAARESAYSMPWSHAIMRVLELEDYQALPKHEAGFIARRLGIPKEEEQRCLELLARTRQIRKQGKHWVVDRSRVVDTRAAPERSREVKDWWARVALDRIRAGEGLVFSYNLFSVSTADLGRIQEAYRSFYQQMRTIIAESEPNQKVVLFGAQMVELGAPSASEPASRGGE